MPPHSEHPTINPRNYEEFEMVVESIRQQIGATQATAEIGIICGSGLGPIGDAIENPVILPYERIPGFMKPRVAGHKGNLVFGTLSGKRVVALQGRFHAYEHGMNLALCALPVRVMHALGCKTLIASCAAGGVRPEYRVGEFMLIKDHISFPILAGFSPLVGVNDRRFGEQFVSLHQLYDKELRVLAHKVAGSLPLKLHEGILSQAAGPQYETPAEVAAFQKMGIDCVGMSVAHEATVAKQCHMRVMAFCLITNKANTDADASNFVCHEEVLEAAQRGGELATSFVRSFVKEL